MLFGYVLCLNGKIKAVVVLLDCIYDHSFLVLPMLGIWMMLSQRATKAIIIQDETYLIHHQERGNSCSMACAKRRRRKNI